MLDYFRNPLSQDDLKPLVGFLYVMNNIIRLYGEVLEKENKQLNKETEEKFVGFLNKIEEVDKLLSQHLSNQEQLEKWKTTLEDFKTLMKKIMEC